MNARLDYKVKALTLRLLLALVTGLINVKHRRLEELLKEAAETISECEAVSDGRQSP
jgi:hypothetical protein